MLRPFRNIIKHLASAESTQEVGKNASILASRFLEEDSSLLLPDSHLRNRRSFSQTVVIFTTTGKAAASWHGSMREQWELKIAAAS